MQKRLIGLVLVAILWLPPLSFAEVYFSAEEATKKIFPNLQQYKTENRTLDTQEFKIFTILKDGEVLGWTVVVEEMGKNMPISFLVGIDNQGAVLDVYVLEFHDLFGSEIKRRSFLRQFQGRTSKDLLIVGKDIDAVTQATISSKAATTAVSKSLRLIEEIRKK